MNKNEIHAVINIVLTRTEGQMHAISQRVVGEYQHTVMALIMAAKQNPDLLACMKTTVRYFEDPAAPQFDLEKVPPPPGSPPR